jgi:uncharacterized protein (TIGR02001 family)
MRTFLTGSLTALAILAAAPVTHADEAKREFKASFNVGLTTDYIFRGFSQTARDATGQGGVDITYGLIYFGLWGSGLDFGKEGIKNVANAELDIYAGIKPVWNGFNFDFGVIGYLYPSARDKATTVPGELDYFEIKAGVSREVWKGGTATASVYFSPEYTNDTGRVVTFEGGLAQELRPISGFTPTISALLGYQVGHSQNFIARVGNGDDSYLYWNAGLTLAWEKFTFDFRYWDTNIKNNNAAGGFLDGFCSGVTFQCGDRFVATVKFTY